MTPRLKNMPRKEKDLHPTTEFFKTDKKIECKSVIYMEALATCQLVLQQIHVGYKNDICMETLDTCLVIILQILVGYKN